MAAELRNSILVISGRKGSGKSHAVRELARQRPRVAVFDVMAEHSSPNVFGDLGTTIEYLQAHARAPRFHCAYRPGRGANLGADVDELADTLFYEVGGCLAIFEEASWYTTAGSQPEGLDMMVRQGRHKRLDMILVTQRLSEISRRATSQADYFLIFNTSEPRDLEALAARCGSEVAGKARSLGQHDRLLYGVAQARLLGLGGPSRHRPIPGNRGRELSPEF